MARRLSASGDCPGRLAPHTSPPLLLLEWVCPRSAYVLEARFHVPRTSSRSAARSCCAWLPSQGPLAPPAPPGSPSAVSLDQRAMVLVRQGVPSYLRGAPQRMPHLLCFPPDGHGHTASPQAGARQRHTSAGDIPGTSRRPCQEHHSNSLHQPQREPRSGPVALGAPGLSPVEAARARPPFCLN
ncbi:hypothetical protein NDU88_005576 [Pleurodeles waltl]|uniref:Uncharacterized protein n=1 Tax=Pleurodeles waltl TaxID=8319 RepID=A0AAV7QF98_PLEWA|nr:hypothetical protein NDU88_005576 [Pleurodeles waltl]